MQATKRCHAASAFVIALRRLRSVVCPVSRFHRRRVCCGPCSHRRCRSGSVARHCSIATIFSCSSIASERFDMISDRNICKNGVVNSCCTETPRYRGGSGPVPFDPILDCKKKNRLAAASLKSNSDPLIRRLRQQPTQKGHRRFHWQIPVFSSLAFAISTWPLTSLIFSFALPRLQKVEALLGPSRIATLKSAMARL
jgi:hypothetical protein